MRIPPLVRHLCDDAAIFPPGLAPLADAVPAHLRHVASDYADLVGPLVLSAAALGELPPLLHGLDPGALSLTVTVPAPDGITAVLATVAQLEALDLAAVEVAVPEGMAAADVVPRLRDVLADAGELRVFVEVPRDGRRPELIAALADSPYAAKFRTGGIEARLYPGITELAEAIAAVTSAGLPFKATAGLHHAIRNTDPQTGFDQHGFLNILFAVDAALQGAPAGDLDPLLAERDGAVVAGAVAQIAPERTQAVRAAFVSFGTCSVTDPLTELTDLGLIDSREGRSP